MSLNRLFFSFLFILTTFTFGYIHAQSTNPFQQIQVPQIAPDADQASFFDISVPTVPFQIGETIPFTIIAPDANPVEKLSAKVERTQTNLISITKKPTTKDGVIWEGELIVLSDTVNTILPLSVSANQPGVGDISGTTPAAPVQMIPLSNEEQKFGYADPIEPSIEWDGILIALGIALILLIVFLLIIGFILYKVYKYLSKPKSQKPIPQLPPMEELQLAFNELYANSALNEDSIEPYYTKLSFILRRYMERCGTYKALELTDYELEELIRFDNSTPTVQTLAGLFDQCSAAKYSKTRYTEKVIQEDLAKVKSYIGLEIIRLAEVEAAELKAKKNAPKKIAEKAAT